MSLRGLDEWITGHYGEDYWNGYEEASDSFICGFCRAGGHRNCTGKRCDCPGRYSSTGIGKEHHGKLALVIETPEDRYIQKMKYIWDNPTWNQDGEAHSAASPDGKEVEDGVDGKPGAVVAGGSFGAPANEMLTEEEMRMAEIYFETACQPGAFSQIAARLMKANLPMDIRKLKRHQLDAWFKALKP